MSKDELVLKISKDGVQLVGYLADEYPEWTIKMESKLNDNMDLIEELVSEMVQRRMTEMMSSSILGANGRPL